MSPAGETTSTQDGLCSKVWVVSRGKSFVVLQNMSVNCCIILEEWLVFKIARDKECCREQLLQTGNNITPHGLVHVLCLEQTHYE